jgi:glycosyltransferase involved in cell wall biosynthesis
MHRNAVAPTAARPVAVVSHTFPGDLNGQAVMLDRLTGGRKASNFVLVGTDRKARPRPPGPAAPPFFPLATPFLFRKMFRVGKLHRQLFDLLVRQRARAIAAIVKRHRCQSILGCTGGDLVDLPAAVEAGRLTGVPAFLYYFDDYRIQWAIPGSRWQRRITATLRDLAEPTVLSRAAGVITPNETLADDVRARTSLPVTVIRNPVDTANYRRLREAFPRPPLRRSTPIRVVYTGSVYSAQADSLRRLCEALELLAVRGIRAELHVYGQQPSPEVRSTLPTTGIHFHPPTSTAKAAELQARADVLFLPLSFTCAYPDLIRTSAPGKFGEYLASGTPLLVHAPADSFPIRFVTQHRCGTACGTPTAGSLADSLAGLIDDPAGCLAMTRQAVSVAEDFNADINQQRLADFLAAPEAMSWDVPAVPELLPAA